MNLKPQIKNWSEVEKYRKEVKNKTEIERTAQGKEKTGVMLSGIKAVNPVNQGRSAGVCCGLCFGELWHRSCHGRACA